MPRVIGILFAALILTVATVARADEASERAELTASMNSLGKAFVAEDVDAIKALMTPDHVAIGPTYDGAASIDDQLAIFDRITLSKWDASDPKITFLSDTVAMSNFPLSLSGTFDDKPLHTSAYVTEIWVKRDGKWLQQLYQETVTDDR